jgi:hypothetical protein
MKRVYSVTINGANDCVVMTEAESSMIALKFADASQFEMYDMTKRHGMKPEHLHKLARQEQLVEKLTWLGPMPTYKKGIGSGKFGGAAHLNWEFQDLMEMKI